MGKPIHDALALVKDTKSKLGKILSDPSFQMQVLSLNQLFDRISDRLIMMGGVLEPPKGEKKEARKGNGPITRFMGKTIDRSKTIVEELNPKEAAKKAFVAKVDKLITTINGISTESILTSYTTPDDVMIVRGAAKKSGVKDFESREMNEKFIEDIKNAAKVFLENQAVASTIEDFVAKKAGAYILTEEMILSDDKLLNDGAEPGDTIEYDAQGKYKIIKAKK